LFSYYQPGSVYIENLKKIDMKRITTLLFLTITFFTAINSYSQKRALTTDDGLNMVNLSGSYLAPNGSYVIFGKSELDWKENKRKTTYHFVDSHGENTYQYIGKDGASDIKFSPDGKFMSFKRAVEKKNANIYLAHGWRGSRPANQIQK